MRYVSPAEFDPAEYLAQLPQLVPQLPPGAAGFAADPGHYDFSGLRCTKNLTISEWHHDDAQAVAKIRFAGSPWKHDEDLIVEYRGVTEVEILPTGGESLTPDELGTVKLDEILPADGGCSHEIAGDRGAVRIRCRDLEATWHRVPRPDDPPPGSWTPEVSLGDRWNWLGRRTDGTWVVGVPHRRADPDAVDQTRTLVDTALGCTRSVPA